MAPRRQPALLKGVIFDFDDTLVNSLETYWRLFNRGVAICAQPAIDKHALGAAIGRGKRLRQVVSEFYPSLTEEEVTACLKEMSRAYDTVAQEFPISLKPHAKEVLGLLAAMGLRIGLVTARTRTVAEMWSELEDLAIAGFFGSVVTGKELPGKPAPDGVHRCLDELGIKPGESVLVGDTEMDIQAGRSAGVDVILIINGWLERDSVDPALVLAVIDDLKQLMDYLPVWTRQS